LTPPAALRSATRQLFRRIASRPAAAERFEKTDGRGEPVLPTLRELVLRVEQRALRIEHRE
jgi:hypothetical protein